MDVALECSACGDDLSVGAYVLLPCCHPICEPCLQAEVRDAEGGRAPRCVFKLSDAGFDCGTPFWDDDDDDDDDDDGGAQDQGAKEEDDETERRLQSFIQVKKRSSSSSNDNDDSNNVYKMAVLTALERMSVTISRDRLPGLTAAVTGLDDTVAKLRARLAALPAAIDSYFETAKSDGGPPVYVSVKAPVSRTSSSAAAAAAAAVQAVYDAVDATEAMDVTTAAASSTNKRAATDADEPTDAVDVTPAAAATTAAPAAAATTTSPATAAAPAAVAPVVPAPAVVKAVLKRVRIDKSGGDQRKEQVLTIFETKVKPDISAAMKMLQDQHDNLLVVQSRYEATMHALQEALAAPAVWSLKDLASLQIQTSYLLALVLSPTLVVQSTLDLDVEESRLSVNQPIVQAQKKITAGRFGQTTRRPVLVNGANTLDLSWHAPLFNFTFARNSAGYYLEVPTGRSSSPLESAYDTLRNRVLSVPRGGKQLSVVDVSTRLPVLHITASAIVGSLGVLGNGEYVLFLEKAGRIEYYNGDSGMLVLSAKVEDGLYGTTMVAFNDGSIIVCANKEGDGRSLGWVVIKYASDGSVVWRKSAAAKGRYYFLSDDVVLKVDGHTYTPMSTHDPNVTHAPLQFTATASGTPRNLRNFIYDISTKSLITSDQASSCVWKFDCTKKDDQPVLMREARADISGDIMWSPYFNVVVESYGHRFGSYFIHPL